MQQFSVTKIRLAFVFLAVLFSLPSAAFADTITLTSSAVPTTTLAPSSDTFSLNDGSGTFDSNSGLFTFQTGDFIIGNSNIPDQIIPFTFQDSITLNGITEELTFSGQDAITNTEDILTIFADPVQFGDETFALQSFTVSGDALGQDLPVDLQATVTPEPGSFVLLGTGMLAFAVFASKRLWRKA